MALICVAPMVDNIENCFVFMVTFVFHRWRIVLRSFDHVLNGLVVFVVVWVAATI